MYGAWWDLLKWVVIPIEVVLWCQQELCLGFRICLQHISLLFQFRFRTDVRLGRRMLDVLSHCSPMRLGRRMLAGVSHCSPVRFGRRMLAAQSHRCALCSTCVGHSCRLGVWGACQACSGRAWCVWALEQQLPQQVAMRTPGSCHFSRALAPQSWGTLIQSWLWAQGLEQRELSSLLLLFHLWRRPYSVGIVCS